MAASTLPAPGTRFGPCEPQCSHIDCEATRKMAAAICWKVAGARMAAKWLRARAALEGNSRPSTRIGRKLGLPAWYNQAEVSAPMWAFGRPEEVPNRRRPGVILLYEAAEIYQSDGDWDPVYVLGGAWASKELAQLVPEEALGDRARASVAAGLARAGRLVRAAVVLEGEATKVAASMVFKDLAGSEGPEK